MQLKSKKNRLSDTQITVFNSIHLVLHLLFTFQNPVCMASITRGTSATIKPGQSSSLNQVGQKCDRCVPFCLFTKENNFFLKILSFCFVNPKNVFTFVHSSKFKSYGM